jgi:hypothetical protein
MTDDQRERLTVEVALIGNPDEPMAPDVLDNRFFDMPYADRRKVRWEVAPDESLAAVLERAAELMGLVPASFMSRGFDARSNRVAFYKPEDEAGFAPRGVPRLVANELVLVDQDGRAIFGVYEHRAVRMIDLVRAAEAGTLDGDPLRPYLIIDFGWGDPPPADWATVYEALKVAWEVVKAVGAVGGAVATVAGAKRILAERLGQANKELGNHPEWMQKGYRPDQFARLLVTRDRTADQVAPLLGCTEDEAEAVLWAMGFALNPENGRWEVMADEAAEMLANLTTAVTWASREGRGWETRFRGWLMRYLETGQPPPFESLRPSFEDDDEDFTYRPSVGERLDSFLARFRR